MYTLFTDTDTDINLEEAAAWGYKLISMPYLIGEKEVRPYEDFDKFNEKEFYDMLRGGTIPKTCGISSELYKNYFRPYLAEGNDILYVHFSRVMSATFMALDLAIKELKEEFPDRTISLIDTKGITICSYITVKQIGEMHARGATEEELIAWADKEVDHFATYFFADDLKFFKASGRVSGLTAFFGNMIGVRPIISMTQEGVMTNVAKAKGKQNALNALLNYMETLGDHVTDYPIIVGHTDAPELVQLMVEKIKAKYGDKADITVVAANPTAGSHCGPNGVGVAFHCTHR